MRHPDTSAPAAPAEPAAAPPADHPLRAVIGTAGHIDHGKTTLVRHLTGMETDRLREEQARGISIELGFAWLDLPSGRAAIVDVPGHERFVRQMIAGAAGIDLVLLVVAADEGVMPQSREHLDICHLLGVRGGAVIITKADLVDQDWLELVADDVSQAVRGTFLEGAPVWTCSATDPASIDAVKAALDGWLVRASAEGRLAVRSEDRPFKLSVDRVFTMHGFGTVATGTTACGSLGLGEVVSLLPSGAQGRVRGLQVHSEQVDRVGPGARVAINIQGLDHDQVHRGEVVTRPGALAVTSMLDVTFTALARLSEPIEDRCRVLVHIGTAQVQGTLALLGPSRVEPGETVAAQLRLDAPVCALPGEPYVVRGFTVLAGYGKTLGGGRALLPQQRRHRRTNAVARATVEALAHGSAEAMVRAVVAAAGGLGEERATLGRRLPLAGAAIERAVEALLEAGEIAVAAGRLHASSEVAALVERAVEVVQAHHRQSPASPGIGTEELRSRIRVGLEPALFALALQRAVAHGALELKAQSVARPGFEPRLSRSQRAAMDAVLAAVRAGGLTPPRLQDLPEALDLTPAAVSEAVDLLLTQGGIVRVSKELAYAAEPLEALRRDLVAFLEANGTIDTAAFKDLTGASRKYTIPLGEYFDRIRMTLRVGDARRLRRE